MEEKKLNIIEADQLKEVKDYNAWLDDFVCIQRIYVKGIKQKRRFL